MARVRARRAARQTRKQTTLEAVVPAIAVGFFLVLPLVFTTSGLDTFRLPKSAFAAAAIGWLTAAFFLTRRVGPRGDWYRTWEGLLVAGVAYAALHTLLLGHLSLGLPALVGVVLFALLVLVLRFTLDWKWQRRVWVSLLVALSIDAALTVLQYHRLLGGWTTTLGRSLGERLTPAGLIGNTNTGGFLFSIAALMLLAMVVTARSSLSRAACVAMLAIQLAGLAHTRTLTAVVVLVACGALGLMFHHWWLRRYFEGGQLRQKLFATWMLVAAIVIAGVGLVAYTGTSARLQRAVRDLQSGSLQRFASGRLLLNRATWSLIQQAPVTGGGIDSFPREFFRFRTGTDAGRSLTLRGHQGAYREAHNEYLQSWAELGIAGIGLLIALMVWPLLRVRRRILSERDPAVAYWIGFLALALIGVMVDSLTFFPFRLAVTASVVALILATLEAALDDFDLAPALTLKQVQSNLTRPARVLTGLALVILGVVATVHQANRWRANRELSVAAAILEEAAAGRIPADRMRVFVAEARRLIEKAEAWDPYNEESKALLGTSHFLSRRFEESIDAYREVTRRLPSPEAFTNLAVAHLANKEFGSARQALDTALSYNPRYASALALQRRLDELER